MKQCPTCKLIYTDETLQFCLQDGTPLQPAPGTMETASDYGEQETLVAGRRSEQSNTPPATDPNAWNQTPRATANPAVQPPSAPSRMKFAVLATVFVMLLIFGLIGLGAWYYLRGAAKDPDSNVAAKKSPTPQTANKATTTPANTSKNLPATATPLTNSEANTNSAPADRDQVKQDVSQQVDAWKEGTESGDVDSYIDLYADRLDYYYTKRNVNRSSVRTDKQNAFRQYSDIRITVSNLTVTPDATGERATAVFDKEWVFDGERRFAGKVQSQMQFKKVDGQWLITGERDLRQYRAE
jgi:hypothetical protein